MQTGGILGVYAHPDDEQMGSGALALCADRGIPVTVVCATRGDAGEISDPAFATRDTLGEVRTRELEQAAAIVGMTPPIVWDYPDGHLGDADPAEIHDRVVAVLRQLRPRVVLTFDPRGGYGHPDHIAIHRATVAAVAASPDPAHRPDLGSAHRVDKLYYSVFPRSRLVRMNAARELLGMEPLGFGSVQTVASDELGIPDHLVTTQVDVRAAYERRRASQLAHRTQYGPESAFGRMPDEVNRRLWEFDSFLRVHPPPAAGVDLPDETDIWAGLPLPNDG